MNDSLAGRLRTTLAAQGLAAREQLILVAVSGGPDSLALLHLLWSLSAGGGPRLHVAHLDHGLRGAQSAAEARFVADTAAAWQIPATVTRRQVTRRDGRNRQAACRRLRYAFLAETASTVAADAVAVAHQADDQAETVLLHLLRGAGPAGLRGMRPLVAWSEWAPPGSPTTGPALIRPLLNVSRAEIEAYCTQHELAPRDDPSNRSPAYLRSRLRHELLPQLRQYNPHIVSALLRTATVCGDDYAYLQQQLDQYWPLLAVATPGELLLRRDIWETLPPSLQRYALRRAAQHLRGEAELRFERVESARALAGSPGSAADLGLGLRLKVTVAGLEVNDPQSIAREAAAPQLDSHERQLCLPGHTRLSAGWSLRAAYDPPPPATDAAHRIAIDPARVTTPLRLRRRQSGDRFRPAGARGSRSLQDFFVDRRVPRELRAAWPLLVSADNHIVWVVGLRADARFQAPAELPAPLWISLEQEDTGEQT